MDGRGARASRAGATPLFPVKQTAIVTGILILAAAVFLAIRVGRRGRAPEEAPRAQQAAPARLDAGGHPRLPTKGGEAAPEAALPNPPASLAGTVPDGGLPLDAQGHLRIVPEVRRFFDYFLSTQGDEALDVIRARIVAAIEARVPPAAAKEAIDLLDRYLAYLVRAQAMSATGLDGGEDVQARLDTLWRVRREVLGDQIAEAFFGEEEEIARLSLDRRRILKDKGLSEEERRRELDALDRQLPESARAARDEAAAPVRLWEDEQALRAKGATPDEIRALRESRFGREAANRLEDLDRERAEWQRRMDAYHEERRRILADSRLSEQERAAALQDLLQGSFTPPERIRLQALDNIDPQGRSAPGKPPAPPPAP